MNNNDKKDTSNKTKNDKKNFKDGLSRWVSIILCAAIGLFISIAEIVYDKQAPQEVTYNEFLSYIDNGEVDTVYYSSNNEYMRFTLFDETSKTMTKDERAKYTYKPESWKQCLYPSGEAFRENLLKKDVNLVIKDFSPAGKYLLTFFTEYGVLLFFSVFMLATFKQMGAIGKGNHVVASEKNIKTRFSDVIGHDEIISDLKFIVKIMSDKNKDKDSFNNCPKGLLFTGDPGTGKTLLAKALAGESGIPFLYMNASSFIEMYVGVGAKRVRELFAEAKRVAPCIIFIDEIDAVGRNRSRANISSEDTQTLNALLQEMDGFDPSKRILVIAATNNASSLDKALVRAGRFDREIEISPPQDWTVRKTLLEHCLEDKKYDKDMNLDLLAKEMVSFTGADITSVVNEAGFISLSKDCEIITLDHIEEAIDKKLLKGNRSNKKHEEKTHRICAYHEAGHAVMCYLLKHDIIRASIINTTSGVGGFVMHSDDDTVSLKTKKDMEDEVMIAYGGRCSEAIKFGEDNITTGASSDIQSATAILSNYVSIFGFENNLINYQVLAEAGYNNNKELISRMNEIANELKEKTQTLLQENYQMVENLAQALIEHETLTGEEVVKAIENANEKDDTYEDTTESL